MKLRLFGGKGRLSLEWEGVGLLLGQSGNIPGNVPVHLNDVVSNVKVGSGAPGNKDCGDAVGVIELPDPVQKWGDGLHVPVDDPLHQLVPDHEVGGAGVLVHEQQGGTGLHALHHIGRLRGTAAGVLSAEMDGVFTVWQVVDEHGDVRAPDAPPVLRSDFYCGGICDYIFPAVACDMVVDAQLQSLEEGGLAVVAAAHNQGDTLGNAHAGELPVVGELQRHSQLLGGLKGDSIFHRQRGDAGGAG